MNTLAARRIVNWLLGLICALAAIGAMAQARPQLIATEGHAATVSALAYSPDGHFYVSGSWDATLRVWHTDTGRLLKKIEAGCGAIYSIAFSPDGAKLAIGCADGSIRLLRAAAWQEEAVLSGHRGTVLSVSFDFSGIQLISGSRDHTVRLWGIPSGKETRVFRDHTDTVTSVTFSPDGLRAASSSTDGTIQVYDLKNKFEPARELRAKREVTAVRFNADGSQLISSGGKYNYGLGGRDEYGEVRIWNAVTGKVIHTQHFDSIVRALTVDPQSGLVYFCISYGARVLDLSNLPRFEWEMKTFEDGGRHAYALAIAPKRGLLAVGAGDSVSQWDVATKMRKKQLLDVLPKTSRAKTSYHSGTQRTAIPVGNEVVLVSTKSNQRSILLSGHTDAIADLAFSPTGKILATASLDGTVRLWDADNGDRLWTLVGHKNWVTSVVFNPNEKTVAGAGTKAILIWNVPERLTEKTSVRSILDAERVIPSWLLRDVEMERRLPASNALTIDIFNPKLRFGPSGDLLAVAGERSGGREYVTELWNVSEGALIQAWKLGASNVRGFAFAPDGATWPNPARETA